MSDERERALNFLRTAKALLEAIDWFSVHDVILDAEDDGKTTTLIGGGGKKIIDQEPTFEKMTLTIIARPGSLPVERDENGFVKKRVEVDE